MIWIRIRCLAQPPIQHSRTHHPTLWKHPNRGTLTMSKPTYPPKKTFYSDNFFYFIPTKISIFPHLKFMIFFRNHYVYFFRYVQIDLDCCLKIQNMRLEDPQRILRAITNKHNFIQSQPSTPFRFMGGYFSPLSIR